MINFQPFRSVVFDLDGVIYRGNTLRKGVNEVLSLLESREIKYHFLTNTSSKLREEILTKIIQFGVRIDNDLNLVTTSSEIAAHYLLNSLESNSVVLTVGGSDGVGDELRRVGIKQIALESYSIEELYHVCKNYNDLSLLIGWAKDFNYETATKVLKISGIIGRVFATDNDKYFSSDNGNLPGTAWINGSITSLLGLDVVSFGKPNPLSLKYVLQKMNASPTTTLLIGDNLFSDIQVGKALDCQTLFVLGGVSTLADLELLNSNMKPDFIMNELSDILGNF